MRRRALLLSALAIPAALLLSAAHGQAEGVLPNAPPPGADVLFDGKDLSKWTGRGNIKPAPWKIENGVVTAGGGDIQTREDFKDFRLHLEFMTPYMPDKKGQARGNSGVIIQGRYEIQVLDSYGKEHPGTGDCGAVYSQAAPLVNACKKPEEWQTYDIVFRHPRYADGKMTERPRVTVFQNGILVQNNTEIHGLTANHDEKSDVSWANGLVLQDHGNPVKYRNIWIVPLPEKGSDKYE